MILNHNIIFTIYASIAHCQVEELIRFTAPRVSTNRKKLQSSWDN